MEHLLVEWERTLPLHMGLRSSQEIPSEGDDPDRRERFRVILTLRYHNVRILIYLFMLVRFLDICGKLGPDDAELGLSQQIGGNSVQICVQSAWKLSRS